MWLTQRGLSGHIQAIYTSCKVTRIREKVEKPRTFRFRHLYTHLNKDRYQVYIGSRLIARLQSCDLRIGDLLERRVYMEVS